MEGLVPWANLVGPWAWGGVLLFARIGTAVALMPDFGAGTVPARIRLALTLALTVAIDLALGVVAVPLPDAAPLMLPLIAREVVIGAALGLAVRLVYSAVTLAGDLVGVNMGLSMDILFNAGSGEQELSMGRLFGVIATLLFFALGGHLIMTATLFAHLQAHPVGDGAFLLPSADVLAEAGVHMVRSGVLLAAPVIVVTLILNVAMGFVMRVVPSINLFGIGLGILMVAGFFALGLEGEALRLFFERELDRLPEWMFELSGVLPAGP